MARTEESPARTGREERNRSPEDPATRIGMDSNVAQRTACKRKGAPQFIRSPAEQQNGETGEGTENLYPPGPAPGAGRHRRRAPKKSFWCPFFFRGSDFSPSARRY